MRAGGRRGGRWLVVVALLGTTAGCAAAGTARTAVDLTAAERLTVDRVVDGDTVVLSGCVPVASDVDCAGGSGNGPACVSGPVRVVGRDVYGLDADKDGLGCE